MPRTLEQHRRDADRALAELSLAEGMVTEESAGLDDLRTALEAATEARRIVQAVAQTVQENAHAQVSRVVTKCLKAVFGGRAYVFRIEFARKRGKTEARLLLVRDGHAAVPCDSVGGGVVDVCAFALRLACLVLSVPVRRRLLVLDEGFKHLSKDYAPRVRELLEALSRELGVQLLLVTHSRELVCGKVIEIGVD